MANFDNMKLTNAGRAILAESIATGTALNIESIVFGDGNMPGGQTPETMTAVVSPKKTVPINSKQFQGNGTVILRASLSSTGVTTGFSIREIGVMARVGTTGALKLYAYGNAGASANFLPPEGGMSTALYDYRIACTIANAQNVVIVIDSANVGRLERVLDSYISTASQSDFMPLNCNPAGALMVVIEGAVTFDWSIVSGKVHLSDPLPAGKKVWIQEFKLISA